MKECAQIHVDQAHMETGVRLYAVGDIHGRADLLQDMHDLILKDAENSNGDVRKVVVYLGDYIDRGHASNAVLDILIYHSLPGFKSVFLRGNHEQTLLTFLADPTIGYSWFSFGGLATLASYGLNKDNFFMDEPFMETIRAALCKALPPDHLAFLSSLKTHYEQGDFFFTHAGVMPEQPLADQAEDELLWIRETFLFHPNPLEKVIVHGHSISHLPEIKHHRIGIDTGAFWSNHLTCLVLEEDNRRFLTTNRCDNYLD